MYGRPGQGSLKAGADGVVKRGGTDAWETAAPDGLFQDKTGKVPGSLAGSLMNGGNAGEVCPKPEKLLANVQTAYYRYEYDAQGNTVSDGENRYRYDSLNRLTEIKTKEGGIQKHRYDGEGLRAELEENGKLTRFLYVDSKAVEEQTEDGDRVRYIRGLELLSSDCESARTYYHYACDELGSVTCVTDGDGKVLNRYAYDAFGNCTKKEEAVTNRFGFAGEMLDGMTGQYYLRARFYSPVIGRFLQEDTYYGDGLNLYMYCRNNPVRYVDPSGHWCIEKQERVKQEYMDKGFSEQDAKRMATYEELRETQGVDAAEKYLKEQTQGTNGYTNGSKVIPKYSTLEQRYEIMPSVDSSVGRWKGKPGESMFISDDPRVKNLLASYGVEGINYKNGLPDFSPFVKEEFTINMTNNRNKNFAQAKKLLAEKFTQQTGQKWTSSDVGKWMTDNKYTWHELNDCKTIQLVPSVINHPVFQHLGGVGEINISIGAGVK